MLQTSKLEMASKNSIKLQSASYKNIYDGFDVKNFKLLINFMKMFAAS